MSARPVCGASPRPCTHHFLLLPPLQPQCSNGAASTAGLEVQQAFPGACPGGASGLMPAAQGMGPASTARTALQQDPAQAPPAASASWSQRLENWQLKGVPPSPLLGNSSEPASKDSKDSFSFSSAGRGTATSRWRDGDSSAKPAFKGGAAAPEARWACGVQQQAAGSSSSSRHRRQRHAPPCSPCSPCTRLPATRSTRFSGDGPGSWAGTSPRAGGWGGGHAAAAELGSRPCMAPRAHAPPPSPRCRHGVRGQAKGALGRE